MLLKNEKRPPEGEVRMKKDEAALISLINHRPLKLPNGDFWYHYVIGNGISHYEGNSITSPVFFSSAGSVSIPRYFL